MRTGYSERVRPLRIAHVLQKASFTTGSVWQMFEAARGLAARGHRVMAVTRPSDEMSSRCAQAGVEHIAMGLHNQLDLGSMRRLAGVIAERCIEILHAHRGIAQAVALGAFRFGAPVALVASRGVTFRPGLVTRLAFCSPRLHRVVCACEAVRRALAEALELPAGKLDVIYPGVDLARFDRAQTKPERVRSELGLGEGVRVIVQVGLRHWKGWKELLAAFARVREEHSNAHLLLVGCRTVRQRSGVTGLAAELGLGGAFTATLARVDIPDVLSAAAVVVDASWAGTGISGPIREAMALGIPVVATAVGGNSELVEHGVDGLLVPARDVATLAAGISRLLRDPALAAQLAGAGGEKVRARFSNESRTTRLEACYHAVLAETGAASPDLRRAHR